MVVQTMYETRFHVPPVKLLLLVVFDCSQKAEVNISSTTLYFNVGVSDIPLSSLVSWS